MDRPGGTVNPGNDLISKSQHPISKEQMKKRAKGHASSSILDQP